MSRLDQMRAQFQERHAMKSGLPRPTKSGIPAPTSRPAAATLRAGNDVHDGPVIPDGTCVTKNNDTVASKPAARNGISHTGPTKLNGHTKAPVQSTRNSAALQPRTGGTLTTMTTAQLRNLAISRQTNGTATNTVTALNKPAPKTAPLPVTRSAPAACRKPAAPAFKKPAEPAVRARAPETAKKVTAMPSQPSTPPVRKPVSASKPTTTTLKSTPVSRTTSTKGSALLKEAPKPVNPSERPLGPNQERCDVCGRGFDRDRIEKHRTICKKAASKKVKVFDATKMRTKGTEVEVYIRRGLHKKEVPVKKSNWRAKHEEFIATVRQAKLVQDHLAAGGKLSDLPPPPPSSNPDYVPCPHCGRKFNEAAASRHIPRCKEVSIRKPPSATRKPNGYR